MHPITGSKHFVWLFQPVPQNAKKGDIIISSKTPAGVTEDGFSLSTKDGILRISGSGNGTVYGVVTLLEQYQNNTANDSHSISFN